MNSSQDVNNKLFMLYLIDKLPGKTESDLVSIALSSLYLDYFSYNEILAKLQEQALIYIGLKKDDQRKDARGRSESRVYLTDQGRAVLGELLQDLPLPMRATVDRLSLASKDDFETKDNVIVNYKSEHDGYYRIDLKIMDGLDSRFDLSLLLPDEASCKRMAKNWKTNSFAIYNDVLSRLNQESVDND